MSDLPTRLLELSVAWLGLLTLGVALTVYLIMEVGYRRSRAREARRIVLSEKVGFAVDEGDFLTLWARSSGGEREIIAEVLMDRLRSPGGTEDETLERVLGAVGVLDGWIRELRHGREKRRIRAALNLGYFPRLDRGIEALVTAADDRSPSVELAAVLSLGRLRAARGIPALVCLARRPPRAIPDLTLAAALAACAAGRPERLLELLHARDARSRVIGAWALSEVANCAVLTQLVEASHDSDAEVRAKVARALSRISEPGSLRALEELARDSVWFVRVRALDALGALRAVSSEPTVLLALEDKVREVRYRAAHALRQINGMGSDVICKVLASTSRGGFNTLISEWDRAGFLWSVAEGLSPRHGKRFMERRETLRTLIRAGATRALADFVLVFPDIKVRLRLLRLFKEAASPGVQPELLALARDPRCDPRLAAKIRGAVPTAARP